MALERRFSAPALGFALLAMLALPRPSHADWSNNPNENTLIVENADRHLSPVAVSDGAGGVFVAWSILETASGDINVLAQHLDSRGASLWNPGGVTVTTLPDLQAASGIIPDGAGGVIIVWSDLRAGDADIYAQRLDASGIAQWAANGVAVSAVAASDQDLQRIVSDGAGGVIVAWRDLRSGNFDVYAQRVDANGNALWTPNGVPVATQGMDERDPDIASDGASGAIIAWEDYRSGTPDIFAQRLDASGAALWTANGVPIVDLALGQRSPKIVSDGNGGAFLAWEDQRNFGGGQIFVHRIRGDGTDAWVQQGTFITNHADGVGDPFIAPDGFGGLLVGWRDQRDPPEDDIYVQRMTGSGTPLWMVDGVQASTAIGFQILRDLVADGVGGAVVVWEDRRIGLADVYGQRVSSSGMPMWGPEVAISTAAEAQDDVSYVTDGAGGAIVVWEDARNGATDEGIYAQRVERFGKLGQPEPVIAGVQDVAGDQGGQVRVSWQASYLDFGPGAELSEYRVWRQVATSAALAAMRAGTLAASSVHSGDVQLADGRVLHTSSVNGTMFFWELVGTMPADGQSGYSMVAATGGDSTSASTPYTVFMVQGRDPSNGYHWDSAPDSGYSVDDLAPPTPNPFTAELSGSSTLLQWGQVSPPDFAYYELHRGADAGFQVGPGSFHARLTSTSYLDPNAQGFVYKVVAVDVHGNFSAPATAFAPGTADADAPGLPARISLAPASPNPMHGSTTLRLSLPRAAHVTGRMFDQHGRLVQVFVNRELKAGTHPLRWGGADLSGHAVASGLYFYTVEAESRRMTGRVVVMR